MLIVISDLHFTDGTAGQHNPPVDAFRQVFLNQVVQQVRDPSRGVKEVNLLLLGDIPDLIRSTHWFDPDVPLENRPWGENGLADVRHWRDFRRGQPLTETEKIALRILGRYPGGGRKEDMAAAEQASILYQNWDTLEFLRNFRRHLRNRLPNNMRSIPVHTFYVPGNHDRLVNLYPSLREEIKRIFGLTITPQVVTKEGHGHYFRYAYQDDEHGAYARHGHQHDTWNYAGGEEDDIEAHLQVPIGDVIATEFAVKLPWKAEQRQDEMGTELVHKLQDMDNVRPLSRLLEWFYYRMRGETRPHDVADALDDIFDEVVQEFINIPFVQKWQTSDSRLDEIVRLGIGNSWVRPLLERVIDFGDINRLLSSEAFGFLVSFFGERGADKEDEYLHGAYREPVWREAGSATQFILYGHTHAPLVSPLDVIDDREVFYINTGTWRQRVYRTASLDREADFVKMKQLTYAIFYNAREDGAGPEGNKVPGTLSFDMWTGHKMKHYRE